MAYPFYPQNYYPAYQQQSNITWVQGIEGAKAYPVGAGNTVILLDSESSMMFIKTSDQSGMPNLRIFDYKERISEEREAPVYVTKKEFDDFVAKMKPKKKKVEEDDDE